MQFNYKKGEDLSNKIIDEVHKIKFNIDYFKIA